MRTILTKSDCNDSTVTRIRSELNTELNKLQNVIYAKRAELSELEDLINANIDEDGCIYEYGDLTAKYQEIEGMMGIHNINLNRISLASDDFGAGKEVAFPIQLKH